MPDPTPYLLPDLGEGMAEAEIVRWEVGVGDHVARDQVVAVVQTDKAEVELPVPWAGVVTALGGAVGDVLEVGAPLLELEVASEDAAVPGPLTQVRGGGAARTRVEAAPPVRKLASELGVDLARVAGSGPGGRITAADVRAAVDRGGAPESGGGSSERRVPLRGIPRAMARNMAEAWRTVPHISLFDEIDARPLVDALRAARDLSGSDPLTLTAFFARASVLALEALPLLNASLDDDAGEIVYHDAIHIGLAVSTDDGLVVPVVHDAQSLGLLALGAEIHRVTAAARAGGLGPESLRGATFSITNFGTEGGRFATPIVRPPQVAILGCGAIRPQPVVDDDDVVAAPALALSLSADHRVVDGYHATHFLDTIAALLREPLTLLTER
ncbi:MAG TPA: dihydrolipoamide acetyltransferase family protein [Acidimicrobiia bacterium]|nr:dihydrolipoamide acetyltransferase family protein [Acidimicrobiia bacterium]